MINKNFIAETVFFEKEIWKRIPVHYRYMIGKPSEEVDELYIGIRFSSSEKHLSNAFINFALYKPVSNILFNEIQIKSE